MESRITKKTFLALFLVVFATSIGMGIIAPLMPLYGESMGASGLWLGIMFSSFAVPRVIFMPVAGRLSDLRNRKTFITLGLLAYTIVSLLYIWAGNIGMLIVVRFLHGLASVTVTPIAQAYVADLTPKGKEGAYINLFSMSMFLGLGCGPLLGGTLTEYFDMNAAFYAMTAVNVIALALLLRFVPSTEQRFRTDRRGEIAPVRSIIRDSKIQGLSIFIFSRGLWRQGIIAFLPLLAMYKLGMTPAGIGLVLSAYLLTGGVTQGLTGTLVDRSSKVAVIAMFGTIGSALVFLIIYAQSGGALLAILLPTAVLGGISRGAVMAASVERGKHYGGVGAVMGFTHGAFSLGRMVGPIAFGYAMDTVGLNSIFIIGATIGIIGSLVATYFLVK